MENLEFIHIKTSKPSLTLYYTKSGEKRHRIRIKYTCMPGKPSKMVQSAGVDSFEIVEKWSEILRNCLELGGLSLFNKFADMVESDFDDAVHMIKQRRVDLCSKRLSEGENVAENAEIASAPVLLPIISSPTSITAINTSVPIYVKSSVPNNSSKAEQAIVNQLNVTIKNYNRSIKQHKLTAQYYKDMYCDTKRHLHRNETFKYIIKLPLVAESGVEFVLLDDTNHEIKPNINDYSQKQLDRVVIQTTFVCDIALQLYNKYTAIVESYQRALNSYSSLQDNYSRARSDSIITEHLEIMGQIQFSFRLERVVDKLLQHYTDIHSNFDYCARTVRAWYNEFLNNNCGGFFEDQRGAWKRDFFLEDEGLKSNFVMFMKMERNLDVDKCQEHLNGVIRSKYGENVEALSHKFHFKYPISRVTAYRWMRLSTAKYCDHKQSYYTDNHDAPATKLYREKYYLPLRDKLSQRMAQWCSVPAKLATKEAKAHLMRVLGISTENDLPVTLDSEGVAHIKIHVDFLEESAYETFRLACLQQHRRPGQMLFDTPTGCPVLNTNTFVCSFGHLPEKCKCFLPCIHVGQDEATVRQGLLSKKDWVIDGQQKLRPKSDGLGEMISALQDEYRGFAFNITAPELQAFNVMRRAKGLSTFIGSPGLVFLNYGANRDGYWTCDMFIKQVIMFIELFEFLYPDHQLALEVDHSSNHLKSKEDGLNASRLNMSFGGNQPHMHSSVITAGCLGTSNTIPSDRRLRVGETQYMQFQEWEGPPFYAPNTPKHTTPMTPEQIRAKQKQERAAAARKQKKELAAATVAAAAFAASDERPVEPTVGLTATAISSQASVAVVQPQATSDHNEDKYTVAGYVGQPKGIMQILWERGLYTPGMVKCITDEMQRKRIEKGEAPLEISCDATHVLATCDDFIQERGILEEVLISYGHILVTSPKCHPELAGVGIEYCWGVMKKEFRRINDTIAKHLHSNILHAMEKVSLSHVWKFARRTRDYCRAYQLITDMGDSVDKGSNAYQLIQNMVKTQKTHRNIAELESQYLKVVESSSSSGTSSMVTKSVPGISVCECSEMCDDGSSSNATINTHTPLALSVEQTDDSLLAAMHTPATTPASAKSIAPVSAEKKTRKTVKKLKL